MKAKMILLLFVMGVILGGCSVKSNKDILLDDTKTIIKYSPYQKMFMDLNSNFTEEDVKKYMGDHRLIGGRSSLGDYFEYHIFLSKDDNKKACQEFVAVRFGNVLGSNGSVIPLFKDRLWREDRLLLPILTLSVIS